MNELPVEYAGCKRVWLCGERELNESDNGCAGGKLLMSLCPVLKNGSCEEKGELPNMCPRGKGIEDGEEKKPVGWVHEWKHCVCGGGLNHRNIGWFRWFFADAVNGGSTRG